MDFYDIEMYELTVDDIELLGYNIVIDVKEFDPEDNIPY